MRCAGVVNTVLTRLPTLKPHQMISVKPCSRNQPCPGSRGSWRVHGWGWWCWLRSSNARHGTPCPHEVDSSMMQRVVDGCRNSPTMRQKEKVHNPVALQHLTLARTDPPAKVLSCANSSYGKCFTHARVLIYWKPATRWSAPAKGTSRITRGSSY